MFGYMEPSGQRCAICDDMLLTGVPQNSTDNVPIFVHTRHAADHAPVLPLVAEVDRVADAIVAIAKARHPGDPDAIAVCAIALTEAALASARPIVSVESPSMSAAELEQRLASPGAKWAGRPWQPRPA